jgi:hypothetical protein
MAEGIVAEARTAVEEAQVALAKLDSDPSRSDIDGFRVDVSSTLKTLASAQHTQWQQNVNLIHLPIGSPEFYSISGKKERVYAAVVIRSPTSGQVIQKQKLHPNAVNDKVIVKQIVSGELCVLACKTVARQNVTGVVLGTLLRLHFSLTSQFLHFSPL